MRPALPTNSPQAAQLDPEIIASRQPCEVVPNSERARVDGRQVHLISKFSARYANDRNCLAQAASMCVEEHVRWCVLSGIQLHSSRQRIDD
jgi:hypothetical protein